MANLTSVGITAGVPTSGTGTVSTIDNLPNLTLTVASHAVTNAGTFAVQNTAATPAGTNVIGSVKATDGTNTAAVKAASTAPSATDPALVVAISPNSVNANGRATPANSAPVVLAKQAYNTVAASQTAQALTGGSGGATGDWLDFLLIIPATTAAGAVSIKDGAGSAITVWAGGGTTALTSLIPFSVPVRAVSTAGAWSVTTGTNVSVIASGNFT